MQRYFFLEPMYGLANRLLMIVSALRLCESLGYELIVVWKNEVAGPASQPHFFSNLSKYLRTPVSFIDELPSGRLVYIPESISDVRTVYDTNLFYGHDIYVQGWKHIILSRHDLLQLDRLTLTSELRDAALRFLAPTNLLSDYITRGSQPNCISPCSFDLGIHVRSGGNFTTADLITNESQGNFWTLGDYSKLFEALLSDHNRRFTVFICGTNSTLMTEIYNLLDKYHNVTQYVSIEHHGNSASPSETSDLRLIADFIRLTNCKIVSSFCTSTFGAFASLIGETDRIVKIRHEIVQVSSLALSGNGL